MSRKFVACLLAMCLAVSCASAQDLSKVKKVTLKLAHIYAPAHPFSIGMEKLVERCYKESQGKLDIQHFPAAQIGNEPSLHEGLRNGTIQMSTMGISEVGKRFERVLVIDAPFLFRDVDHMLKFTFSDMGKKLWADFEAETGITMLGPMYYGTRQLTTNKAVPNTAALAGMKIRVPDQPNSVEAWKALGAVPTPMNLNEVYLSLQTGVVDGQENPLATIITAKFYEVCKFINMTNHQVQCTPLFIKTDVYRQLDPALRAILDNAVKIELAAVTEAIKKYEVEELKRLQAEEGVTVVPTDAADFRAKVQPAIKSSEGLWGKGAYDSIQALQ